MGVVMKKRLRNTIGLVLIAVVVVSITAVVFAANDSGKSPEKDTAGSISVKLDITKSKEDISIIKSYQKKKNAPLSKAENNIEVVFTKADEDGDSVIVSGTVKAKMFGDLYESSFEDKTLEIKHLKKNKFYTGCIEAPIDSRFSALIDITTMGDFGKTVITYTLVDEQNEEQQVMFYGDTFKEQIQLMKQEAGLV